MFKRLAFWHGRSGAYNNSGICARTLLVYQTVDGYHEFCFGDPGMLENVERHSGCGSPPQKRFAVGKVWVIGKQLLWIHNVGTNILLTFARSSSRVEVAFVRFRLYKRRCLQRDARANAPLVYRFHSLTVCRCGPTANNASMSISIIKIDSLQRFEYNICGRMDGNRNAHIFLADTYGLLSWIFSKVVRVEMRLGFVGSLRPDVDLANNIRSSHSSHS